MLAILTSSDSSETTMRHPAMLPPCTRAAITLNVLSGRWTLRVLWAMREGPVRLGQLCRLIPDASRKMLTETLRKLERAGLLVRRDLTERVPHVEYHLNPAIHSEVDVLLNQLASWGELYETEHATGPRRIAS